MTDKEYFSHLYEIASHLNREFSLAAALRRSLEKTVQLLALETGWIWLAEPDGKSVYLAASYNLPPALGDHPERLSGWCYCIDKYLAGGMEEATNISEISCSRLQNISAGTRDLRFHATIPIITNNQKVGLLNLLSEEKQQLGDKQLAILNTISELIGIAVQRTRMQEAYGAPNNGKHNSLQKVLERILRERLDEVQAELQGATIQLEGNKTQSALTKVQHALQQLAELRQQLALVLEESQIPTSPTTSKQSFRYPASPLTPRELEVLALVKKGHTNAQIAEQLYIAERTVKFHMTSILSKLHAETRTQAVDIALQRGLISS